MAKDLPYFKFFCSEWSDGDITLEDMNVQGLFVNLCAYYWSNECDVKLEKAKRKFRHAENSWFENLIESEIIQEINGNLTIKFLDEQKAERDAKALTNRENGKLGGRPRKDGKPTKNPGGYFSLTETKPKQKAIREEKRRKEKKREEVKAGFKTLLSPFLELYGAEMLNDFYSYWTEHGENDYKVRYQKEKSFSVERRLRTWSNRSNSFTSKPKKHQDRL